MVVVSGVALSAMIDKIEYLGVLLDRKVSTQQSNKMHREYSNTYNHCCLDGLDAYQNGDTGTARVYVSVSNKVQMADSELYSSSSFNGEYRTEGEVPNTERLLFIDFSCLFPRREIPLYLDRCIPFHRLICPCRIFT